MPKLNAKILSFWSSSQSGYPNTAGIATVTTIGGHGFQIGNSIKLDNVTPEELEEIRVNVWKQAMAKRLENNKKMLKENDGKQKDKHVWTSLDEFQFHGFKIRPPKRNKDSTQKPTQVEEQVSRA